MWGSDYPHDEGTHPYTTQSLRRSFAGTEPVELQQLLPHLDLVDRAAFRGDGHHFASVCSVR